MELNFGKFCFRPRPATSFLALLFFVLFIALGFWQLDRADYKRTLYTGFLDQQSQPPLDLNNLLSIKEDSHFLWRHAKATGRFDESQQILLDNQIINSQVGYFVYTAFQMDGSNQWVLVNRGWVAVKDDRSTPPALDTTETDLLIKGVIKPVPKTGFLLKELPPERLSDTIIRVQKIDLKEIEGILKKELLPIIIRLEPESGQGYRRDWSLPGSGEKMHQGYAFQWFAFAITLLLIYFIMNTKQIENHE